MNDLNAESIAGHREEAPADGRANRVVDVAAEILRRSAARETRRVRARGQQMARMLGDPTGKAFTIALADQILRFKDPARGARRFRDLLERFGPPGYLGRFDQLLLVLGAGASRILPGVVMPKVAAQVRRESSEVILRGEARPLSRYLKRRCEAGTRVNINQLGEAVLGEEEAQRRLEAVLARLADPQIGCVSVKISAIFSQIQLIDYPGSLHVIKQRLRRLYRAAMARDGERSKFVNLDMEEYRDLHLTVDAFRSVLDEPEFMGLEAGIVLQAYLPDAFQAQQDLTAWAKARRARGGEGIKIRLVKGANLAMEQVEASLHDWPQAPYHSKREVDANFKRMLRYGCEPANAAAVRLGVASHNLFDVAHALLLREEMEVADRVEFEMLEGMANAQAAEVQGRAGGMLVYAPVVREENFQSAIAYLVRRLEENTAPENFLHDLFGLEVGSAAWERQRERFLEARAFADSQELPSTPNRRQNRLTEHADPDPPGTPFSNVADTDFSLPQNREWIDAVSARTSNLELQPSPMGGAEDVERALAAASAAQSGWERQGVEQRSAILKRAAAVIFNRRGDAIGCMMREARKAPAEADAEVSEAVDFADYYARAFDGECWRDGVRREALGIVLVTPPWNFPYAIPAGGCLAALMAGNSVILKPAPETTATARLVAEHLWEAGVPRDVLQFLPVPDNEIGRGLVTDERVAAVILTGACETARLFQSWRPDLRLFAETSGKNSMIITQAADLDLAIKDLVRGAFGHAGQKCSATSLALVEAAVYDDSDFRRQLKDAAQSLRVGAASDRASVVTPLIREPGEALMRGLTRLDSGEEWLLEPRIVDDDACLWSPGIRLAVQPGSWFHRTECFGPVLGLIRARDLEHAIAVQNDNAFGLTGGIHSLDEHEVSVWRDRVEVGNAYINRATTGAIVRRQPFGGWKRSCFGPGAKAGGPNYVSSFAQWSDEGDPIHRLPVTPAIQNEIERVAKQWRLDAGQLTRLQAAAESYAYWWREEFSQEHDPSQLRGESNTFRYRPRSRVVILSGSDGGARLGLARAIIACSICGVDCAVANRGDEIDLVEGTMVRVAGGEVLPEFRRTANAARATILSGAVVGNGRVELLNYLREQSISETTHRYGNLAGGSAALSVGRGAPK